VTSLIVLLGHCMASDIYRVGRKGSSDALSLVGKWMGFGGMGDIFRVCVGNSSTN